MKSAKFWLSVLCPVGFGLAGWPVAGSTERLPMRVPYEDSAQNRWLLKPVMASRVLDEMETLDSWVQKHTFGYSQPSSSRGEMVLSHDRVKYGSGSIRLRARTKGDIPGPQMGRPFGSTSIVREFPGEDWRSSNRLSFWVYPDLPGFRVVSLLVVLHNQGDQKSPGPGRLGQHFFLLNNHQWNQVVWEIPDLPRDKVTAVEFQYRQQGHEPGAASTVEFYFDRLEIQLVDPDYFEGWPVAPGRIAYSHSGYPVGAPKTAVVSDSREKQFEVIDLETAQTVFQAAVRIEETPVGRFGVLDFGSLNRPGTYLLKLGQSTTRPFRIDADIWINTVWKTINYFLGQRCGTTVPGIHDVCHRDWLGVHGDKRIVINGGWHDAGDVCQGLANTSEAVFAMFELAERLESRSEHADLAERLREEGSWGLDFILKNNFGDGYRILWATHDYWTDGILGTVDDVTAEARNDAWHNFLAAASEATAFRLLRERNPRLAGFCLENARQDWSFALKGLEDPAEAGSSFFSAGQTSLDAASAGVVASAELFLSTGDGRFAEVAVQLAARILEFQQQGYLPGLEIPLAGFFWESPAHDYVLHRHHLSSLFSPAFALARLCEVMPDHPDWIRWYAGVALHAECQKRLARYTLPYGMLAESLYHEDEYLRLPAVPQPQALGYAQATREDFREQVKNGVSLGAGYYLRLFPVWFNRRGNHGTILPQAKSLAMAGHLRRDLESVRLAEKQLEWVVGRNPFGQSTMTGEGHDFVPHYSALSGDIVGSLPVGIETLRNRDLPYWPVHNHMNTKETWVHPVSVWISLVKELSGSGAVDGRSEPGDPGPVRFRERESGLEVDAVTDPGGRFRIELPPGDYQATQGRRSASLKVFPGSTSNLELRRKHWLDVQISAEERGSRFLLRIALTGSGVHRLSARTHNVALDSREKEIDLGTEGTAELNWEGKILSEEAPWLVVLVPDGDLDRRTEVVGFRESVGK